MSEKKSWAEARELLHRVLAEDGPGVQFILANTINAAEERGRRRGIEELDELRAIRNRITEYLSLGGLFNPEMMDHGAVSRLLQDAGIAIDAALAPRDSGDTR